MKKKILCTIMSVVLAAGVLTAGCGAAGSEPASNEQVVEKTVQFIQKENEAPMYGMVGGEWTMFDLMRAGVELEDDFVSHYLTTVENALIETNGVLNERRYTEYSRVVLAFSALGQDVTDVAGFNLIDYLSDYEAVCKQGMSGPIWALIAMDSLDYEFSKNVPAETIASRELFVQYILDRPHELGGWGYDPSRSDPDLTAMAIVALAPYADENADVAAAIDKGIQVLSELQGEDGTYVSGGVATGESCAQVVLALSMMGIDADTDERFIKNGTSVYDALLDHQLRDGSFEHIKGDGFDMLATEQICYCLLGYERFLDGENSVFDLSK